ncbi:MAG: hypothetical protein BGP05_17565 [Rhizobiales bacterium 62-47]|nr:MAG: hypothetical protein BGP05_17565 [Rhizobiales bacterium 62-47]
MMPAASACEGEDDKAADRNDYDRQDFGACQSSQIGPHLVQPLRTSPRTIKPKTIANRLDIRTHPHAPR